MSVFFERFTLFCVITVVTALSLIIVTTVQLAHEPEIVINRDNERLLDRLREERRNQHNPNNGSTKCPPASRSTDDDYAQLFVLVHSPRANRRLRRAIRSTWAHRNNFTITKAIQVKFALTRAHQFTHAEQQSYIRRHVDQFHRRCVPATYLLITSDLFFINTLQILLAINQRLPQARTIICAERPGRGAGSPSRSSNGRSFLEECNLRAPILLSADAFEGDAQVHFGEHLYLSQAETGQIINGSINAAKLLFFFSASISSAADVERMWTATQDYAAVAS